MDHVAAREHRTAALALRAAEAGACALAGGRLLLWLSDPAHAPGSIEGNDARVFYDGAALFLRTGNPYGQGFVSPPWFALALAPLTLLPFEVAAWLWLGLSLAAIAGAAWVALGLAGFRPSPRRAMLATLLLAWWPPGEAGLLLGQNSSLVLALAVAAVLALCEGRLVLAATVLALAMIKPQLVGLLALGMGVEAWRTGHGRRFALGFGATLGLLLAMSLAARRAWVPALLAGLPESWNYWGSTVTVNTWLAAALGVDAPLRSWLAVPPLAAGAALTGWLWWRRVGTPAWRSAATLALTFLATPYAYPHDYILLLLPALVLGARLAERLGRGAAPVCLGLGALAWALPRPWVYDDPARFLTLGVPLGLCALLGALGPPARR